MIVIGAGLGIGKFAAAAAEGMPASLRLPTESRARLTFLVPA